MLASVDAVEALEAALAARSAQEPDFAQPASTGLLSPAVQGMILLNISAALFGSNQVRHSDMGVVPGVDHLQPRPTATALRRLGSSAIIADYCFMLYSTWEH